ncbi:BAG family molecular chaperone regulator 1 [Paramuricea clavata]|uniref:BAG family molecular chaperone regulator 1 n=1 Tax=Paramuricea clavata TaxID=317549 RepID=A0A7D9HFZ1_PARCT|nr:BAG family molecular chaperone regulator 1 [Paramuricea clavata]
MAVTNETPATLDLIINHGPQKHAITLHANSSGVFTVQSLAEYVEEQFGVPPKSQKLIHKGKSLQEFSAKLSSYGIKSGSKIMLIGSKYALDEDPNNKQLSKIDDSVDEQQRQLGILLREFDGIKQGYLEEKLALESVNKLIKKTKGIIEENMKMIEFVDSLEIGVLLKRRRKNLVIKMQSYIDKADKFIEALNKYSQNDG